jgi:hypothetical protein
LPSNVQEWLQNRSRSDPKSTSDLVALESGTSAIKLQLSYVGQVAPDEILLRLLDGEFENDNLVLKRKLALSSGWRTAHRRRLPRCGCWAADRRDPIEPYAMLR